MGFDFPQLGRVIGHGEVARPAHVPAVDPLILRHPDRGSYTVARAWTDGGLPEASIGPSETTPKFAVEPLLQLANLCAKLTEHALEDLDE